ncbi:hypothetical protein JANAI62_31860 [Jannaschia pagri]|uniref:DUF3775 domain-containing protein n=1 Tax=Jannaschia pagri TaxID=2829797 RepID=A0ABQ4NQ76_9RHOB|nr:MULTISPECIES: DUF3775 domain-containing protein [unclassified Jannaschia]GIT92577.1 hypothetical protein JANAI61_30350 [Jannaschia sp. AI_61]GIT96563.1 hypothetical protein JANAI62_31860 [Jannaschia sp. AI_62]
MAEIAPTKIAQVILYGQELDRAEPELRGFLETLGEEERYALVAIMWIGRESFAPEEFAEALATARREGQTPTADYLIGTPHFADHLEAGMEALGMDPMRAEEDLR